MDFVAANSGYPDEIPHNEVSSLQMVNKTNIKNETLTTCPVCAAYVNWGESQT